MEKKSLILTVIIMLVLLVYCEMFGYTIECKNNACIREDPKLTGLSNEEICIVSSENRQPDLKIDSVHIMLDILTEFHIDSSYEGYARAIHPTKDSNTIQLSKEYCKQIMLAIDTLFVQKTVPVIISRTWHAHVTCPDYYPIIDIHIYSSGRVYRRQIKYAYGLDFYDYVYSHPFKRIADNILNIEQPKGRDTYWLSR